MTSCHGAQQLLHDTQLLLHKGEATHRQVPNKHSCLPYGTSSYRTNSSSGCLRLGSCMPAADATEMLSQHSLHH